MIKAECKNFKLICWSCKSTRLKILDKTNLKCLKCEQENTVLSLPKLK